jgi:hypothetical protein
MCFSSASALTETSAHSKKVRDDARAIDHIMRRAVALAQFLIANQHSFDYQPDHACNRVCSQETLMTLGRILLVSLCSAASLTIVSGAQAADLPVKAKAVEYVRVCSLYGAGFFYSDCPVLC